VAPRGVSGGMDDGMGAAEAGNYKGVMLCNRPMEQASRAPQVSPAPEPPSFRPVGLPAEPIGLNPAKENLVCNVNAAHEEAARRRAADPSQAGTNFLNRHRMWLADMAKKKATLNRELQESARAAEDKRTRFVAYTREMREAVRERAAEMDAQGIAHAPVPGSPGATKPSFDDEPAGTSYAPPPRQAAPPATASSAKGGPSKPAWAMTEQEADVVEDQEAEDLVDFAQSLDYDAYIDDLEVRQALNVIRERIDTQKALDAATEAAVGDGEGNWRDQFISEWNGDDDTASQRSKRAPIPVAADADADGGKQPDWDSSTNAGDEHRGPGTSASARAVAESMLRENPNLAAKHSTKSLATIVEKGQADALPPLRVVTIVENPKVPTKLIDPSNLPYLHRNPAV